MTIGIYSITNKVNNKRYIGRSVNIEKRFIQHRCVLRKDELCKKQGNRHLYKEVKQYGISNFNFEILEVMPDKSIKPLEEGELKWMDHYKTTNREFGYNIIRETLEGRQDLGEVSQIKKAQHKAEDSPYGEEWKAKISKHSSELWKDLDKKSNMAKKLKVIKRKYKFHQCTRDGTLIKTWEHMDAILEENPEYHIQAIYSVCSGYKKTYKGFVWKKELTNP